MGIYQKAIKTYDTLKKLESEEMLPSAREPLGGIGCKVVSVGYIINLDLAGNVTSITRGDDKAPIPVTEKSESRTSGACPHPFHEQICYASSADGKRHPLYMESLKAFADYTGDARIRSVITYLEKDTLMSDIEAFEQSLLKEGKKPKKIDLKSIIYWTFDGFEKEGSEDIIQLFRRYYMDTVVSKREKVLCMFTGETDYPTRDHPKSVMVTSGNGKLISAGGCEDDPTKYLGKFRTIDEALTISYTASQKAHAALRWLCTNTGIQCGSTHILCWDEKMSSLPSLGRPIVNGTAAEEKPAYTKDEYLKQLALAVKEYMNGLGVMGDICTASIRPSVKGRIAISQYIETKAPIFLERLRDWDEWCSCMSRAGTVMSPGLYDISKYAYGIPSKTGTNITDGDLESSLPRLITCRTEGMPIPKDIVYNILEKADRLMLYPTAGGGASQRERLLFTLCSVLRKYKKDYDREEYGMALEENKNDRSYQFGRLLAVFEKYEYDTFDEDEKKKRQTNALRLQSTFSKRPVYGMRVIKEQLQKGYAHKHSAGARVYYDKLVGEIMDKLSAYPDSELNKPLEGTYILGYYMQKNALYTKKQDSAEAEA